MRRKTINVSVGDVIIGSDYPIVTQSMTTASTLDTEASVEEAIRIIDAGGQIVRVTAPNIKEAEKYGPQHYAQRGENCPPRLDDNIIEYLDKDNNEEYAYVYTRDGEWKCFDMNSFDQRKSPELTEIPSGALAV